MMIALPIQGRGTPLNPLNRFETLALEPVLDDADDAPPPAVPTVYLRDTSRSIIAHNDSPDVGFDVSINPYRGCEHGCIYCFARPTHEYLSYSAGLDFETRILVKLDAPELLRAELMRKSWQPQTLAISGVTDCYQPAERQLKLTRRCLEVLREFRHPVVMITKSHLITRDIDLLADIACYNGARVHISITTLDNRLASLMEPRAAAPQRRLDAIAQLSAAGVPVGVLVAPVIPGLTDHELPTILKSAAAAGAVSAGFVPLRLPGAVGPLFVAWLKQHFPDRTAKILSKIRAMRGGRLNDPNFKSRMRGEGHLVEQIREMFHLATRKYGLDQPLPELSVEHFRRPGEQRQMTLW
jgi:DNA repair photolyase